MQATGRRAPAAWRQQGFNDPAQPVTDVDFDEATAFCAWLTEAQSISARGLRAALPTEAEWEYAARGFDGRRYPWGDETPTPVRAVYDPTPLARVGEHPTGRRPFGHEDLAGNVWEWTDSVGKDDDNPVETLTSGAPRVVRGGSWNYLARDLRCASRYRYPPMLRFPNLGLRVVVRVIRQSP